MLKKTDIDKIAELLKIDGTALNEAIRSEQETAIEIPDVSVFTADEIAARDSNKKAEGKTAGIEMLVKELKRTHGVEFEGKDPAKFIEAYTAKVLGEANVAPDKKLAEANTMIEALRGNLQKAEDERDAASAGLRSLGLRTKALSGVEGEFVLAKDKILNLMTAEGYSLDEDGGTVIFKQNGDIVRDAKTQNALPASDVLKAFAQTSGLIKEQPDQPRGRGAGNSRASGATAGSLAELEERYKQEGKSTIGAEFIAEVKSLAKDNPDFFNS